MPKPRFGKIPAHRLADARRAVARHRDSLVSEGASRVLVTILADGHGFGVEVRYPHGQPVPRMCLLDGVPVRVASEPPSIPGR